MVGDDDLDEVLATQLLRVEELQRRVKALQAAAQGPHGEVDPADLDPLVVPAARSYAEIIAESRRYLADRGRLDARLEDLLTSEELRGLRIECERLRWAPSDIWTVGLSAMVGSVAAVLAGAIDEFIVGQLGLMQDTDLIRHWTRETAGLPIDYAGEGVGGPAHRLTSAGHDIGRPVEAIGQIVQGQYEGTAWTEAGKAVRSVSETVGGMAFTQYTVGMAIALWGMHLVTDVITPTSLPLPGWTALYEVAPTEQVADLVKSMYWTQGAGPGWNLRTLGITKMVPLVVVEVGVRSKLGWDAWNGRGQLRLTPQEGDKRDEMLLAANGIVALVSTGQVVFECLTTSSPLGLRALNPNVLLRTGHLGVRLLKAHRRRKRAESPSWEELARTSVADLDVGSGTYQIG